MIMVGKMVYDSTVSAPVPEYAEALAGRCAHLNSKTHEFTRRTYGVPVLKPPFGMID
jgi:hypothetical protein